MDGTKERQGDFVFTAQSVGEYQFCFNNEMSTFAEKMVDFEIAVRCLLPTTTFTRASTLAPHPPNSLPIIPCYVPNAKLEPSRSRMSSAHNSPPARVPAPSKPPTSRNPSTSCPRSYRPSPVTRSTSAHARIATLALSAVPSVGFSTSV
jgi:hypothetical protein